jgi:hypothetical protein
MGVGFQLCQPQNAINFLPHEKRDDAQLSTAARMRLEDNIHEA